MFCETPNFRLVAVASASSALSYRLVRYTQRSRSFELQTVHNVEPPPHKDVHGYSPTVYAFDAKLLTTR
jgi:phosphatidylethanolamine-binding protein (PEBP) family uncharacterized protein